MFDKDVKFRGCQTSWVSKFASVKLPGCQTPWVRFNIDPLMESSLNTGKLQKAFYKFINTVHSNTIYPLFLSKTKPKLVIVHRHHSRCLRS